jgi:hypothetical protein
MTVIVAKRLIYSLHNLDELSRRVLRLVDGGTQWLDWAVRDPEARYHFDDEAEMVAAIQSGLHGSPLTLLPGLGLRVGPAKLMTLSADELKLLDLAEAGGPAAPPDAQVGKVLARHNLLPQQALLGGGSYLQQLGIAAAAVFQGMGLAEQIAVRELARDPAPGELVPIEFQKEAALFALGQARTPLEFIDYFRIYVDLVDDQGGPWRTPEDRADAVQAAIDPLLPLLFGALDCPRLDGGADPGGVSDALAEWFLMGRRLGFARISDGARQIVSNTDYARAGGAAGERTVDAYLDGARNLLAARGVGVGRLGQDGASCDFRVMGDYHEATVALGADGVITLADYRPIPAPGEARVAAKRSGTRQKAEKR